ncbi:MAG: serine hydrolase, partial [Burkholderiales bacterium]|nr:serine hydrolase [Burkholderiales bacterium]
MLGRRGRVVLHQAVGRLAPGGAAMAPDALFRIYSMTKP